MRQQPKHYSREGLTWCSRILSVVSKFGAEAQIRDSVGIDNRGTSTGNHRPYAAVLVQNGQFEGCSSLAVQVLDVPDVGTDVKV